MQADINVSFGDAVRKPVQWCSILMYPLCILVWVANAKVALSCKAKGSRHASALDGAVKIGKRK